MLQSSGQALLSGRCKGWLSATGGKIGLLLLLATMATVLAGCPEPEPSPEILPRRDLLQKHNERAEQFVRLWSECRISVRMPREFDDKGRPVAESGRRSLPTVSGNFILRKPLNLYVEGRMLGSAQFGMHSNQSMYWLYVRPENTAWVGRHGGAGEGLMPIQPGQLLRALGIYEVGGRGLLVFRRDPEMDVLQVLRPYSAEESQRVSQDGFGPIYISEEIYLDRFKHLPAEVRLYDLLGEVLVHSRLQEYEAIPLYAQVELTEAQLAEDPFAEPEVDRSQKLGDIQVPHSLEFYLPQRDTTITLTLSNVDVSLELEPEAFDYVRPPVDNVIDVDAPTTGEPEEQQTGQPVARRQRGQESE